MAITDKRPGDIGDSKRLAKTTFIKTFSNSPSKRQSSFNESVMISKEVNELFSKGAIASVEPEKGQFLGTLLLVPRNMKIKNQCKT